MADKKKDVEVSDGTTGGAEGGTGKSDTEQTEGETPKKPSLLEQTTSNMSANDWFNQFFKKAVRVDDEPKPESVLDEVNFDGIARYIASDKCKKIVTMAGAGISTSAGIPDFRSPGTGIYDNLDKYNLPDPHAVFDISFFKENPEPFFVLCKELFPENQAFKPTPCHYFITLLEKKKKLLRHFTQNIDTLERVAGLSDERIIEAHGSFNTGHCQSCNAEYTQEYMKERIFSETAESPVPKCSQSGCDGVVKPDVVFFGESLPRRFSERVSDLRECDCLIVMGTSLVVQPFASLTSRTTVTTPRLYINREKTNSSPEDAMMAMFFGGGGGFDFDSENNIRDVFWQGDCDAGCYALADKLGWGDELRKLVKDEHARIDKEQAEKKSSTPKPASKSTDVASQKSDKEEKSNLAKKSEL